MVEAATGTGRRKDWGFHEEPPAPAVTTGTTGKAPATGWGNEPVGAPVAKIVTGYPLVPDLSAIARLRDSAGGAPPSFAAITGANRTFTTTTALGPEIFRLKQELKSPAHDANTRAAIQQMIVMRQAEWVTKAKAEGLREPTGPVDPFRSSPKEIANAFLWSQVGGVIPRDELARDGGAAFTTSVRDAVVLHTRGFDAMVKLHEGKPEEQRALYAQELKRRGVEAPPEEGLDALRARYLQSVRDEETNRKTIGLDGRVGTATDVDRYERQEAIDAMSPGTTLGSMMATYSVLVTGEVDVERMRNLGQIGNAAENMLGGAGTHLQSVAREREPPGTGYEHDDFNRSSRPPKFKTTEMKGNYGGEDQPDNKVWAARDSGKPQAIKHIQRPAERAPYKLEARTVTIDGKPETRLFDANGKLFDTRDAAAHDGAPVAIFVMNAQGEIFASTFQERAYFHHSTLSGGQPVAAAGELVVHDGKVVAITNRSGHYQPPPEMTDQLLTSLREKGVNLSGVEVTTHGASPDPFHTDTRTLP